MGHLAVICPHYKGKTESSEDALREEESTSWQVWMDWANANFVIPVILEKQD